MAFSDPQSITRNSVAVPLPRTGIGVDQGTFESNDGLTAIKFTHSRGKRVRHIARLDEAKVVADPYLANVNTKVSMSVQVHVDVPITGYAIADQQKAVTDFIAYLTPARVTQLLGFES